MAEQNPAAQTRPRPTGSEELVTQANKRLSAAGKALRGKKFESLKTQLLAFEKWLITFLDRKLQACATMRAAEQFDARIALDDERCAVKVSPSAQPDGRYDYSAPDSQAAMNVSQGLSAAAVNTAAAVVYRMLFRSGSKPYILQGRGAKAENANLLRCASALLDYLLVKGNFDRVAARPLCRLVPQHGSCYLRYEPGFRKDFIKDPHTGAYRETRADYAPVFTIWPVEDVYVTDYQKPNATDQSGVFWITPETTLRVLEASERTYDYTFNDKTLKDIQRLVDATDATSLKDPRIPEIIRQATLQVTGKYVNLDFLREDEWELHSGVSDPNQESVAMFPSFPMAEYEGPLPIAEAIRDGIFTPELAEHFNILVGADPAALNSRDWAALANRVPIWRVAWTSPTLPSGQRAAPREPHVVLFDDCPYRQARTSLYALKWIESGSKFLGYSVTDMGHALEDAADSMLNTELYVTTKNAHPTYLTDRRRLANKSIDEIKKLLTQPDSVVEAQLGAGVKVSDIVMPVLLEMDPALPARRMQFKSDFEDVTGVSAAAKGAESRPSTGTLGQVKIEEGKSIQLLGHIVLGIAMELCRLMRDVLSDVAHFLSRGELIKLMEREAGELARDLEKYLTEDETDRFGELFEIKSPVTLSTDNTVVSAILERLLQLVGPAVIDPRKFVNIICQLNQLPVGENLLTTQKEPLAPEVENNLMAQGVWVDPNNAENFAEHLSAHFRLLQALSTGSVPPDTKPEEMENLMQQLPIHIQDTMNAMRMVQQIMQSMAGGAPGQPNKSAPGSKPNQPTAQAQSPKQVPGGMDRMETDTAPGNAQQMRSVMQRQAAAIPGGNLAQQRTY